MTLLGQMTEVLTPGALYRWTSSAVKHSCRARTAAFEQQYSDNEGMDMYAAHEAVVWTCPRLILITV